jgi:hypothetical protein
MTRVAALLAFLLLAVPAMAQPAAPSPPPRGTAITVPPLPSVPQISTGHAAALGAGLFAGAVAGSALINGGALASIIGAAAGLVVGNWYWNEYLEPVE